MKKKSQYEKQEKLYTDYAKICLSFGVKPSGAYMENVVDVVQGHWSQSKEFSDKLEKLLIKNQGN